MSAYSAMDADMYKVSVEKRISGDFSSVHRWFRLTVRVIIIYKNDSDIYGTEQEKAEKKKLLSRLINALAEHAKHKEHWEFVFEHAEAIMSSRRFKKKL